MDQNTADFIIIGGGIAGASAGYELCKLGKVILLEKEKLPGFHTTGRSSAIFQKSFNKADPLLNILVTASEPFLRTPPDDFTTHPLLNDRPLLYIAQSDDQNELDSLQTKLANINIDAHFIEGPDAKELIPVLSEDYQGRALLEQGVADIDVGALHNGYLRAIKAAGGQVITQAAVTDLEKKDQNWHITSSKGCFQAPIVVNAAGAWVDQIAEMAHITPINIQPLRRTVILVPSTKENCPNDWPLVMDTAQGYYFKPDSGKVLMTPGDHHLSPPSDVQPEEIDIAYAAHYLEQATTLSVDKIDRSWAGLRNHVSDGYPVVGFDPKAEGFFWLAGQGGYGIKTAPVMGRITANLIAHNKLPDDVTALGLSEEQISIRRLR